MIPLRPPLLRHLSVAILVALSAAACGATEPAVEVGGTTIDRDELAGLVEDSFGPGSVGTTFETAAAVEVLDQLVLYQALIDLLAEHGVEAGPEDLERSRDRLLVAGLDPETRTIDTLTRWQAALDLAVAGGDGVRAAYLAEADRLGHELCTSHILVAREDDAAALLEELTAGGDFAELAGTLSQDPGSASRGGSLGCVPVGSFVPTFERAVLGGIRTGNHLVGPVPSQFGFHVIRVDRVSPVEPATFDQVGERIPAMLLHLATLSRDISIDPRYGTWDPVVGRVLPPEGPASADRGS